MPSEAPTQKPTRASRLWIELAFFLVVFIAVEALEASITHQVTLLERLIFWSAYVGFRLVATSRKRSANNTK